MSENGQQPELSTLEHGRYRVLGTPDGGMVILRTADTCERCAECGCGEKREPIGPIPEHAARALRLVGEGKIAEAVQLMMKNALPFAAMMPGGRNGGGRKAGRRG